MKAIQLLSVAAVLAILGTAVAVATFGDDPADPGPRMKWDNTDIIDNVYPGYEPQDLGDNYYAYVLNDRYSALSGYSTADEARKAYNDSAPINRYNNENTSLLRGLLTDQSGLSGPDSALIGLYSELLYKEDRSADLALLDTYVGAVADMDTEEEFAEYVRTGGPGCFRDTFVTKSVMYAPGETVSALELSAGTFPWHHDGRTVAPDVYLERYRAVLDLYFADSPDTARTYYDDLVYASERLQGANASDAGEYSYSELVDRFTAYPMAEDVTAYHGAGLDRYVVDSNGYLDELGSVCSQDGYRYARAMAMYSVLYDSAYRIGEDYMKAVSGNANTSWVTFSRDSSCAYSMLFGKYYTQKYAGTVRAEMTEMADTVVDMAEEYFDSIPWISDDTMGRINTKLDNLIVRIAGPEGEQWDQYDYTPALGATSLVGMTAGIRAANEAIMVEQTLMGRGEYWPMDMSPQTYNAFYYPTENSINLMLGFFLCRLPDLQTTEQRMAMAYTVVGHEITHGFDSTGSNFGPTGAYDKGWMFTAEEKEEYDSRIEKLVEYLDGIAVVPGQAHSGEKTNGEVTADMGGMAITLRIAEGIEGFDYDLFFRSCAEQFSTISTLESYEEVTMNDVHPSGLYRCNLTVMQFREFCDCYGIEKGDNMYQKDNVNPWCNY